MRRQITNRSSIASIQPARGNMYVCKCTYRIPPQGRPGLLPNRQGLRIVLPDGEGFGYRKEGVDDGPGIAGIKGKDVGFVGQQRFRQFDDRLGDGGGDAARQCCRCCCGCVGIVLAIRVGIESPGEAEVAAEAAVAIGMPALADGRRRQDEEGRAGRHEGGGGEQTPPAAVDIAVGGAVGAAIGGTAAVDRHAPLIPAAAPPAPLVRERRRHKVRGHAARAEL